jgi:hypothetical protein
MLEGRFGSKLPLRGTIDPRPELGAQPKQIARKLTFVLERPKMEVFSPWLMPCQNGKS